jgi:PhnB protein
VTSIQPELRVDRGAEAVTFYQAAFGATVLHRVGDGEDIVAQLAIGDAAFWVSTAGPAGQRIHSKAIGGATSRTLLIVDDPEAVFHHAVTAGATPTAPLANEHGWQLARITDPFGHQWEIGRPSAPGRHPHPNHHRQLAYASAGSRSSACRSPGSAPPADGGASAFIAEQIGESGTSSSQGL